MVQDKKARAWETGEPTKRTERMGLSRYTVKCLHTTLKLAPDMAVRWNAIESKPVRAVDTPCVPRRKVQAMPPVEEVARCPQRSHARRLLSYTVAPWRLPGLPARTGRQAQHGIVWP